MDKTQWKTYLYLSEVTIYPLFVKQVVYAEVKDINFKSAWKLKADMENI